MESVINTDTTKFLEDLHLLRTMGAFKRDKEVADIVQMSTGNFSQVLNGKRNMPKERIQIFSRHFDNLLSKNESKLSDRNYVTLYNNIVATGGKMDTLNTNEGQTKIQLGDVFKDATGAMWVHGHSMYPEYENGCMVGFREIKDHSIIAYNEVYIIVTDEMCLIKKINKHSDPKYIIATSINDKYEPFEIARDKIRNLFIVLGKISRSQMNNIKF